MFYEVETNGVKWDQQAEDHLSAAVEVFKRAMPESVGALTRIREFEGKRRGKWQYVLTETVLRAAGLWLDEADASSESET